MCDAKARIAHATLSQCLCQSALSICNHRARTAEHGIRVRFFNVAGRDSQSLLRTVPGLELPQNVFTMTCGVRFHRGNVTDLKLTFSSGHKKLYSVYAGHLAHLPAGSRRYAPRNPFQKTKPYCRSAGILAGNPALRRWYPIRRGRGMPPPLPQSALRNTKVRLLTGMAWSATKVSPCCKASARTASKSRTPLAGSRALSQASKRALLGAVNSPP